MPDASAMSENSGLVGQGEREPRELSRRPEPDHGDADQSHCSPLAALAGRATCSIDEAAAVLGIGRSTAYAAARDGSLPTLRLSHRLLVPTAKLFAMVGLGGDD